MKIPSNFLFRPGMWVGITEANGVFGRWYLVHKAVFHEKGYDLFCDDREEDHRGGIRRTVLSFRVSGEEFDIWKVVLEEETKRTTVKHLQAGFGPTVLLELRRE